MQKQVIKKTADFAKKKLSNDSSGHDWWHVYRVWQLGKKIAKKEKADIYTVELICLLHDIADYKLNNGNEQLGLNISKKWLKKQKVPNKIIENVLDSISKMSFKGIKNETKTLSLEGKCAQDADRLDALGAIGISRVFAFGGYKKRTMHNPTLQPRKKISIKNYKNSEPTSINHFYEKILHLNSKMKTKTGKQLAKKRHLFTKTFLKQFQKEWNLKS